MVEPRAAPSPRGRYSPLRWLFTTPGPAVAVSIVPERVTAVQVESGRQGAVVRGHGRAPLPEGAVRPAVRDSNLADAAVVADAVDDALGQLPRRPRRVALLLPDGAARVSMVRFANVPARAADLDAMIRWQIRRTVPFGVDEAQLDWSPGRRTAGGEQEFVVVVAQRTVIEEYEQACTAAGVHAGLVDLLGFGLIDAALAGGAGDDGADWLLVHTGAGSISLAVVRGRHPLLFRTVAAHGQAPGAFVHQTAMYYEDRLGGAGLARALIAGAGDAPDGAGAVRRSVEDRLAVAVEPVAGRLAPLVSETDGPDPALLDGLAAPVGVLLRDPGAAGA